ncbi:MAG: hypothetical protein ACHQ1G_12055 [Planctomycetota bacterium]
MRSHWAMRCGAVALIVCCVFGGDEVSKEKPVRRFQIELLYTIHTSVDTDAKLERIRALVLKIYPRAKFKEVSVEDRRTYFATYRDRLLATVGKSWTDVVKAAGADPDFKKWDEALRARLLDNGYQLVKDQVSREVELRSIYEFFWLQAKDEESLKATFDQLKERDDPKDPVCGTEPGKTLVVFRDFGGKGLTGKELEEIEDGGVKFGLSFKPRVTGLGTDELPKMSRKADTLGDEGHGRQIFRLVAVTSASPPDRK